MIDHPVVAKRKLIEVALPLDAINKASAREKSIRHGHPSTLHLWWARRPLAAARAVIFSQMVDDPSANPDLFPTEAAQEKERQRLFKIIEDLVLWENTTNETVLQKARDEIWQSWRRTCAENANHPRADELFDRHKLPAFHDPFAGGGSLPLEAQRLGLEAHASDLNPVAVLINKAMIEIPPKFAGKPPVNPDSNPSPPSSGGEMPKAEGGSARLIDKTWRGAEGLADDVRYYGQWMRDEAEQRIGHLYPKAPVTAEMAADRPDLAPYVGRELTVIAWLWARTVKSPNPAFADIDVPLAATFILSKKKGKEAWVEPVIEDGDYQFKVRVGSQPDWAAGGTKAGRGSNFICALSGTPIGGDYIKAEGQAGRMGSRLMAIVAEGDRSRIYLAPNEAQVATAHAAVPQWRPTNNLVGKCRDQLPLYGMETFGDIFTDRQLVALTTFSDLVSEARKQVWHDAIASGLPDDDVPLRAGGLGATAYAEAVSVYLAFALSRMAEINNSLSRWENTRTQVRGVFGRQAIPMLWDFAENNVFGAAAGDYLVGLSNTAKGLVSTPATIIGEARQEDARTQITTHSKVVSTDPPYYDNVGYADLSDFFYVWLRKMLSSVLPEQFSTLAVPKDEELIATPHRHQDKNAADQFFLRGMTEAMRRVSQQTHPAVPTTIYYAFKQAEQRQGAGLASSGWDTFLEAIITAGLTLSGTWPMRTELSNRMVSRGTNALASSIVLVCRPRPLNAATATRREFQDRLRSEFPDALAHLQRSNIAPVDLAQASIGPGMRMFTEHREVLNADGSAMTVREALALINATLDEVLAEQEGDFDSDTRWALTWSEQHGFDEGEYGDAEQLSKAKNTSANGLVQAGVIVSRRGKVRLLHASELNPDWDPATDQRPTVWEMTHHLIRLLESGGEPGRGRPRGPARRAGRDRPRPRLPSLRRQRPQEASRRRAPVQRPGPVLVGDHASRPTALNHRPPGRPRVRRGIRWGHDDHRTRPSRRTGNGR